MSNFANRYKNYVENSIRELLYDASNSSSQTIHDSLELCFSGTQCLHLTKSEREPLCTYSCSANLVSSFCHRSKWIRRCLAVQQTASVGITVLLNLHYPRVVVSSVVPIRPTASTPVGILTFLSTKKSELPFTVGYTSSFVRSCVRSWKLSSLPPTSAVKSLQFVCLLSSRSFPLAD